MFVISKAINKLTALLDIGLPQFLPAVSILSHNLLETMYHFANHQFYHQTAYQQQCPIFVDNTKHPSVPAGTQHQFEGIQLNLPDIQQPEAIEAQSNPQTVPPSRSNDKKKEVNKSKVDTSNFSIEERLVAAVWVHERKNTKTSMSQIRHEFLQRFAREPPAKNTLLTWERKLFSTGSVHDAPRAGRPINRRARAAEVAASVRALPALSLRARARALRLPRTTLRTMLRADLPPAKASQKKTILKKKRSLKAEVQASECNLPPNCTTRNNTH